MILKFVDREKELHAIENTQEKIILIYGRRRLGKTRLIKEFIKNKKAFYFLCHKNKVEAEFGRFLKKFNRHFSTYIEAKDFEEFFEKVKKENIIFVFDEFSYLVERNPEVPSIFQCIVDEILPEANFKIILCGSLIGTMESLLSYKQPLYGRIKLRIKLEPLKFRYVREFLPSYTIEDQIKVFACVGGVPAYLQEFDDSISFKENLKKLFFNKFGPLYDEAERLLKDELRNPEIYFRILEAIASGETTLGKIASRAYVDITNLPKYLKILESMGIVRKVVSLTGKNKMWRIKDNYFNFWINFVYKNKEEIELECFEFQEEDFKRYMGRVFEDICKELALELTKASILPAFTRIGKWWYKDKEIDLVALNEKTKEILFGECKWKSRVNAKKICKELAEKAQYVQWYNDKRKESFAVFAKSFSKRINEFEGKPVYCFDLKDLERVVKS